KRKVIKNPIERIADYLVDEKMTEADRRAIKSTLMAGLGNQYGGRLKVKLGSIKSPLILNILIVGETSKGRKGEAIDKALDILKVVNPSWIENNISSGLKTGPGLIQTIINKKEDVNGYKKLFIIEEEGGTLFNLAYQKDNNTHALIRITFDQKPLQNMTVTNPQSVKDYLLTVIVCITPKELEEVMPKLFIHNGSINRFGVQEAIKENSVAIPGEINISGINSEIDQLKKAVKLSQKLEYIELSQQAKQRWTTVYQRIEIMHNNEELGDATARAHQQILRMSAILALSELSEVIENEHIDTAYNYWKSYAASAYNLFCQKIADKNLKKLLTALQRSKKGLTRTQIRNDVFQRNKKQEEIDTLLNSLKKRNLARMTEVKTKGRPAQKWVYTNPVEAPLKEDK
ncbi:DUF3987 domain-containing protein, partial [Candidatus Margulisiibacteriota bacterium]